MIRTPSHKWFVSHKKQLVTLRVCLPKVPFHLIDLQVEPTHISLNTFRFSRKYQLDVKFPEECKVNPYRANAFSTDKGYILVNVPFAHKEEESSPSRNIADDLAEEKQICKGREESSEIQKEEQTPFLMEKLPLFRSVYKQFCQRLMRDIPSAYRRRRILLSFRSSFFSYLRGNLSLWELKQIVNRFRKTSRKSVSSRQLKCDDDIPQKVSQPKPTKDMLLRVAEEVGSKVDNVQQMKNEKERELSMLFQSRQQKKELRRERRRLKRKFAKNLAHQRIVQPSEVVQFQRKTRDPVVQFSVHT
ncbi:uncharacterized protein Gasu_09860 [Galdieria sulphuraria]|uniref:Uncharacterized protein n=1 Tax=Galdieria sulphuraria TaxID=130081 RepID=M2W7W6_GALSU|nr:uncharacterized protein Gasu_09860 [Galdieria sulphuraria]EME31921.1 hypothetical protein Gasu_09860 [Galdieria sulphuraria]|eukprot:XP_005708441.1 hypothetical protein Gasu_09860 [Galdieria sulphuraria]